VKSNVEWKQWGRLDPLYGVASIAGRQRDGENPWTDEEFYVLGEDWNDFKVAWLRTTGFEPGSVLEIGSGAGRITRMLSATFAQVIATDVSSDILEYARDRISADNISWHVSDGDTIPVSDASVDAVFSCHVFQHFPNNATQLAIFREVHRVLKTGATFFIHLPIHTFPVVNLAFSRAARLAYRTFLRVSSLRAAMRRTMIRAGIGKPYMHGVSYEMGNLFSDLENIGFADLSVSAITVRSGEGIHSCVTGRKS
jgi:ubiquinone/menaquinone biosynthesis C-methylase UbiE